MRDYQRRKQTKYILPRTVYHQTIWRIRDYYRLKELAEELIEERAGEETERVQNNAIGDKVASTAIKRERFLEDIRSIDSALEEIPKEYQCGVWNNVLFGQPYPIDAGRATYGRYKSKFIYIAAEKLRIL